MSPAMPTLMWMGPAMPDPCMRVLLATWAYAHVCLSVVEPATIVLASMLYQCA